MKTVLLVDNVAECRVTTKWFLTGLGYAVESVRNPDEALALFDPGVHDLIITDEGRRGALSGEEMAHIIKLRSPSTPVLMCAETPPSDPSCLDAVVQRPTNLVVVKETVDRLLAHEH